MHYAEKFNAEHFSLLSAFHRVITFAKKRPVSETQLKAVINLYRAVKTLHLFSEKNKKLSILFTSFHYHLSFQSVHNFLRMLTNYCHKI